MDLVLKKAINSWSYVAPALVRPRTKKEFSAMVAHLDELLDIIGDNDGHPLLGLVDILSELIEDYEQEHCEGVMGTGVDALRYLMIEHNLRQSDLHEIASQGVISEILIGKRELNIRQIKLLAKKFNVSLDTFIDYY